MEGLGYPVSVDLLLVAAWRRLRSDGPSRLAWCWFVIALFASLGANIATAGFLDLANPPALLRLGIAGWPALAFLGGTLLAHSGHRQPHPPAPTAPAPAPNTDPAPEPERLSVREPEPEPVSVEQAPALPAADPAPAVPAVLIEHARKVADDHQARTGTRIDTDTTARPARRPAPAGRRHRRPTHLTPRGEGPSCLLATTSTP